MQIVRPTCAACGMHLEIKAGRKRKRCRCCDAELELVGYGSATTTRSFNQGSHGPYELDDEIRQLDLDWSERVAEFIEIDVDRAEHLPSPGTTWFWTIGLTLLGLIWIVVGIQNDLILQSAVGMIGVLGSIVGFRNNSRAWRRYLGLRGDYLRRRRSLLAHGVSSPACPSQEKN